MTVASSGTMELPATARPVNWPFVGYSTRETWLTGFHNARLFLLQRNYNDEVTFLVIH
ncbi:hypothetical protein [Brevibacterium sp. VCM10]|uniref:hypothetical protein n=1 Tax=Brevibacterium sp. VCM10 TaxID=1381751 RepID=UPI0012DE6D6C|nr:hypothetical protein [Brevibacterium sp. VCM10]